MFGLFRRKTAFKNPLLLNLSLILQLLCLADSFRRAWTDPRPGLIEVLAFFTACNVLLILGVFQMRRWAVIGQFLMHLRTIVVVCWIYDWGQGIRPLFFALAGLHLFRTVLLAPAVIYWRRMTW